MLKAITARYTAEESVTNRALISDGLVVGLNEKLNELGLYVTDVNIIDFDFSEAFITLAWDLPYLGITAGYIVPILCSGNLVANFILSFIDKHFTDYSLIYMFLNILVGVVPWIALLIFYHNKPPLTWSICLVINVLAFFGLIVFKGRTVLAEFKKRFHL